MHAWAVVNKRGKIVREDREKKGYTTLVVCRARWEAQALVWEEGEKVVKIEIKMAGARIR